jgi:hypothetical protein
VDDRPMIIWCEVSSELLRVDVWTLINQLLSSNVVTVGMHDHAP